MTDMCKIYADAIIMKFNDNQNNNTIEYDYALTNTRLQKLLYYVYIEYAVQTQKPLFYDTFVAVERGPVIIDVYNKYSIYQFGYMFPFSSENEIKQKVDKMIIQIIEKVLLKTSTFTTSKLVENTHEVGSPWYNSYHSQKASKISFNDIYNFYSKPENLQKIYN